MKGMNKTKGNEMRERETGSKKKSKRGNQLKVLCSQNMHV